MNKKEAIDKIKNIGTLKINDTVSHQQFDMVDKNKVLDIISRINEPKKVVVPKFVAYWYEENKDDFESNLYKLFVDYYNCYLGIKMMTWFHDKHNKPIETLVKMKLFGYEVEKEKLYIVEIPNPNDFIDNHSRLARNYKGKVVLEVQDWLNTDESYELTEAEIKEDFEWAWQFAKEVKE